MAEVEPPDLSQPLRRPSERLALVEYVAASPTLQESEHLEWKSAYDLSRRPDAGKVAKQLIGFANRDPVRAQRLTGGFAYLLLGVEAGSISGVPMWDSADIESWLSRFVPAELMYDLHYVKASGKNILVFEIDPPQPGDAIFCLRASTGDNNTSLVDGSVYVRRGGKTEVANAVEIEMLTARARSGATDAELALDLVVESQHLPALSRQLLEPSVRQQWIDRARAQFLKGLPTSPLVFPAMGESRTPAEFENQVDAYLEQIAANWSPFALSLHATEQDPSLSLAVANQSDENFESVVAEITVPLPASYVGISSESVSEQLSVVERPVEWETLPMPKIRPGVLASRPEPQVSPVDDDRTKVRFSPIHVYPRTTHPLDSIALALGPEWAGSDLKIEWRATAANTRGLISGEVLLAIPARKRRTRRR